MGLTVGVAIPGQPSSVDYCGVDFAIGPVLDVGWDQYLKCVNQNHIKIEVNEKVQFKKLKKIERKGEIFASTST